MAETEIFRSRTEGESKINEGGFLDIRTWRDGDVKQQQLAKISEFEYKTLHKDRKPFCTKCAINAVDKKLIDIRSEIDKALNKGKNEVKFDFNINYSNFVGDKIFDELDSTEVLENKLIDGIKQKIQTGIYKNYICRDCGFHLSIEFKMREVETTTLKVDPKSIK